MLRDSCSPVPRQSRLHCLMYFTECYIGLRLIFVHSANMKPYDVKDTFAFALNAFFIC